MFFSILLILGLVIFVLLMRPILRAKSIRKKTMNLQFFLPNDFFITLVLFTSYWAALLIILGAQQIPDERKQIAIIVTSLFAPFLSWWRQKKAEEEL